MAELFFFMLSHLYFNVKRMREQEPKSPQDIDKSHFGWYYYNVSKNFFKKYKNGATDGVRFAIYRMKGGSFHGRQENN
jgi:hypothetical protein